MFYKGEGGRTKSVQGIDFWIIGRPSRVNRMLGTVTVKIAPLKSGQPPQLNNEDFNTLIEGTAAKAASTAGASAAILEHVSKDRDGTVYCNYRLVVYLPEGAVVNATIFKDETIMDADGNKVLNGLDTPIRTLQFPDIRQGNRSLLEGVATVRICVEAVGAVSESSIITSSGHKELDALALEVARNGKYSPATVRGRPVSSCKAYKITWKNH
jgi:TonB family protein